MTRKELIFADKIEKNPVFSVLSAIGEGQANIQGSIAPGAIENPFEESFEESFAPTLGGDGFGPEIGPAIAAPGHKFGVPGVGHRVSIERQFFGENPSGNDCTDSRSIKQEAQTLCPWGCSPLSMASMSSVAAVAAIAR